MDIDLKKEIDEAYDRLPKKVKTVLKSGILEKGLRENTLSLDAKKTKKLK